MICECKYVEMTTGFRDINWTRPNIRVDNIWVHTYLHTYVFVGYMCISSPTDEKAIVYPLSNNRERNSCRLYVCLLSNGQ